MCYTEIKVSFYANVFKNSKCLGHIPSASQIQPHPAVVFLAFSKRVAIPLIFQMSLDLAFPDNKPKTEEGCTHNCLIP